MTKELRLLFTALCKAFSGFIEKAGSRKFILMLISTYLLYIGLIPAKYWMFVAMSYQGVQGGQDLIKEVKSIVKNKEETA